MGLNRQRRQKGSERSEARREQADNHDRGCRSGAAGHAIKLTYCLQVSLRRFALSTYRLSSYRDCDLPLSSQPKSSRITLPSRTIMTGRPVFVWYSFFGSIPRLW